MFCPNCGANLPDGTAFCGNCGAKQEVRQPAPQPQYQQPVYQPQPAYQVPAASVSKKEYLSSRASAETKKSAKLIMVTFLACLVLLVGSVVATLVIPFYDIPAMSLILTMADADPDELTDMMEDACKDAQYNYEYYESTMTKAEKQDYRTLLDSLEALTDNTSILNFTALVNTLDEVGDDYLPSSDVEEIEEMGWIMNIVIIAVIGCFVLPLIFTLVGGLTKSTGLTVTAVVLTALAQLIFSGFLWVVLSLLAGIFQATLCSKVHKAYLAYRNTGRIA